MEKVQVLFNNEIQYVPLNENGNIPLQTIEKYFSEGAVLYYLEDKIWHTLLITNDEAQPKRGVDLYHVRYPKKGQFMINNF